MHGIFSSFRMVMGAYADIAMVDMGRAPVVTLDVLA